MQNAKQLRFTPDLIRLIENGQKTSTWRLWDDKNLIKGDIIEIIEAGTNKSHGFAKLIDVVEKELGSLSEVDRRGHEAYKSDKEMFREFEKFYQRQVNANTLVKIIRFKRLPV